MFVGLKKFSGKRTTQTGGLRRAPVWASAHSIVSAGGRELPGRRKCVCTHTRMRQRVLCTLGRVERLQDEGLDALIQGLAKFSIHGEPKT